MALIIKFMANYFFKPGKFAEVPKRDDAKNDDFLFNQGPTKGLGKIRFHDYKIAYGSCSLPNVKLFKKQINKFKKMLMFARPTKNQAKDIDFLLILGEIFTLVAYGQLILENKKIYNVEDALIDQIFDFMVRDFSKYALQLYSKPQASALQRFFAKRMIKKPVFDKKRYDKIWNEYAYAMKDQYTLKD
jgi:acyl-CoA dehydrogenase